ncbi:putative reverse transcriptase domain-containing protein [Tanacetum coccineum]
MTYSNSYKGIEYLFKDRIEVKGDKQEAAFQLLKQKLCSAPILALPEGSEDFIAYYDASKKGLGAVLRQREKCSSKDLDGTILRNKVHDVHDHKKSYNTFLSEELNMRHVMVRVAGDFRLRNSLSRREGECVADALRGRNENHSRVRLSDDIGLDLPKQILRAQTEVRKPENIKKEDVGGVGYMFMATYDCDLHIVQQSKYFIHRVSDKIVPGYDENYMDKGERNHPELLRIGFRSHAGCFALERGRTFWQRGSLNPNMSDLFQKVLKKDVEPLVTAELPQS